MILYGRYGRKPSVFLIAAVGCSDELQLVQLTVWGLITLLWIFDTGTFLNDGRVECHKTFFSKKKKIQFLSSC